MGSSASCSARPAVARRPRCASRRGWRTSRAARSASATGWSTTWQHADRGIAMVFQSSALYPHLDVAENLDFPLKLKREPAAQRFDRVRRTAGGLGIAQLLNRRPRQLSVGQRQRAALGRAIVRRPQAFLMDEPLSNLDANLRVEMRATIARLHRDLGTTVLYVTHDQAEAMALGDRVAVMRDGHLEQVDEPQVLYDRPAALFVAAFIGSPSMNLWQVQLVEQDGRVVVMCGKQRLVVPEALLSRRKGLRSHVGDHLILGLRPELLAPADSHAAGSVLELRGHARRGAGATSARPPRSRGSGPAARRHPRGVARGRAGRRRSPAPPSSADRPKRSPLACHHTRSSSRGSASDSSWISSARTSSTPPHSARCGSRPSHPASCGVTETPALSR